MRILHILNKLTNRGNGIVNVTIDLASEQVKLGHKVAIVAGGGEFIDLVQDLDIEYFELDQTRRGVNLFLAAVKLRSLIRKFQPDIIHTHMRTGLILAWICSRIPRRFLVGHLHNVHDLESSMFRIADRVIAVSESVRETMSSTIDVAKLRVVLNGSLHSRRTTPLSRLTPRLLNRPSVTTVAGMNHRKGISELIHAFELVAEEFKDAHLYLVGEGPERLLFEDQASKTKVNERIHFEGCQADPQSYMLATDVFVLASRRDSLGLVLAEARQTGCAIVATAVDGIPEALDNGSAGILVPPKDPKALAYAICELLRNDELRLKWQTSARSNCEFFSAERMALDVERVYIELLNQHPNDLLIYSSML